MRPIDADVLIKDLNDYIVNPNQAISEHPDDIFKYNSGLLSAIQVVMDAPTIKPERKTGKWIKVTQGIEPEKYMCSFCHRIIETYGIEALVPIRYPYCHCGAKMRNEKDEI